jgi:hypothetical protein
MIHRSARRAADRIPTELFERLGAPFVAEPDAVMTAVR